jgi:bifunctional UDP-N-acetylglucosamine pyrophosphorylase/glucosamine-1-phosphate N-acetyltransferase
MIKSVILAAGEGTRMKSKLPKVMHEVCGKPMLFHILDVVNKSGVEKNLLILGHSRETIEDMVKAEYKDVIAKEQPVGDQYPYGTGFAVKQAIDEIDDKDQVLILCGDTPLLSQESIEGILKFHTEKKNDLTVMTTLLEKPFGYGRIVRNERGIVKGIVEQKDASLEQREIREINSGIYVVRGQLLKQTLSMLSMDNAQNEMYLTDIVRLAFELDQRVEGYILGNAEEILGVNTRVQLEQVQQIMRRRINEQHMLNGVEFIDARTAYIDKDVKIGQDTTIYPNVILQGTTTIGDDCIIGSQTKIVDSVIGDRNDIQSTTILSSTVENDNSIGPFAYLRPNSKVASNIKIGDFVEVKNTTIKDGSKVPHLAYVGDGEIGESCNIGCGVIFCNYDGKNKHKTKLGDHVFIGSNSNLVAPVEVESYGYVAAGSTITNKVEERDLAIARARQVNKKNWVK